MSETLQPRTYVPLPTGYDPYTFARGGGPAHLFFNRPVVRAPEQTAEVTVTAAGGSEGDFRLPPVMFIPDVPGQRTIGNTQGGTYVQNPDAVPFSPSTGSISRDLANIANIPGLTGAINSVLTGGPAGALSVLGGTALSSLTSDPRVTTITGGLGDLYREAQLTPEERAARQETRRDLDAMTDRDIMNRFGITVEDLPDIVPGGNQVEAPPTTNTENISATYGSLDTAPSTTTTTQGALDSLSTPGEEADVGSFSAPAATAPSTAVAGPTAAAAIDSLSKNAAALDALLATPEALSSLFGIPGEIEGVFGANLGQLSPESLATIADIGSLADAANAQASQAAAAAAAAQAEANAVAAQTDADDDTSPSTSTESNTSTDSAPSGPGEGSADGSAYREGGLVQFAQGGVVALEGGGKIAIGPGGGLDDLIPTSINGRRAAALSDGEFVIPADVVSMMGDGSSNAGARRLYDLVKQIRQNKTGTAKQAGPLPAGEILKRTLGR